MGLSSTPNGQTPVQNAMHPKKFVTNVTESKAATDSVLNESSVDPDTAMRGEGPGMIAAAVLLVNVIVSQSRAGQTDSHDCRKLATIVRLNS